MFTELKDHFEDIIELLNVSPTSARHITETGSFVIFH